MISSMFGGKLRFSVKYKLHKIQGFPVAKNMTHEMGEPGNLLNCNQLVGVSTNVEPSDQVKQGVVAPSRSPPKEVDWNVFVFHASVGHMCEALLAVSAKPMGVELAGHLHPCVGCLAAKVIRKQIPK